MHLFTATFRVQLHPFSSRSIFCCKSTKKIQIYRYKNTVTKNNKIQLVIMEFPVIPCQVRIMERN